MKQGTAFLVVIILALCITIGVIYTDRGILKAKAKQMETERDDAWAALYEKRKEFSDLWKLKNQGWAEVGNLRKAIEEKDAEITVLKIRIAVGKLIAGRTKDKGGKKK